MQATDLRGFHLSIQQTRLWSLQQNCEQAYRVQCLVGLHGRLDRKILIQALHTLVERNTILRTRFYQVPGMDIPVQVVQQQPEIACQTVSLLGLTEAQQNRHIALCFAGWQEKTFHLEQDALFRVGLFHLSESEYRLLLSLPALCADSTTLSLLLRELGKIYQAYLTGDELDEEPLQYADVSAWQDDVLQEGQEDAAANYWSRLDLSPLLTQRLPFTEEAYSESMQRVSDEPEVLPPHTLKLVIEQDLVQQLRVLISENAATCSDALFTCWKLLHWRLSNDANYIIGFACDGRIDEDLENAPGPYTRVVPVVSSLTEELSFEQVLKLTKGVLEQCREEQFTFTWDRLQEANPGIQLPRFLPVSFEYTTYPASFANATLTLSQDYCYTEPCALKLSAVEIGEEVQLTLSYDPRACSSVQAARLGTLLRTLLQSIVAQPSLPIGQLSLLSPEQQWKLFQAFRAPMEPLPTFALHQLFESHVKAQPDALAVVCGEEQLTYQCLNKRANQLGHLLAQRGVGPNTCVGLCVSRSVQMLICLLGILKAGGAYVPLDTESPPARLEYQLRDTQALLLLTEAAYLSRIPDWGGQVLALEDGLAQIASQATRDLPYQGHPEHLAYVIYTSGSTGMPKGVLIRQQSILNYTQSLCKLLAKEPGQHLATVSTLAADLGNTAIFCALASGGCLHILPYESIASGEAFARVQSQWPVDVLKIVPSHLSALLSSEQAREALPRRFLVLGGEALPLPLLQRLRELGGSYQVLNHYGPTETTIGVLVNVLPQYPQSEVYQETQKRSSVAIGRPIDNIEAYVLDQHQQPVPIGVTGELYIAGPGLAQGYLHQAGQTAERFLPHPFTAQPGVRLYRTGDLTRYTEDGQIEFIGRRDGQIKLRGYRIELREIEAVLQQHRNILEAVVLLRADTESEPALVAYVVPRQQPAPASEELRTFMRGHMPEYMVPTMIVMLDRLPLTTNGKIDRQQLPRPQEVSPRTASTLTAPGSPIEELLLEIWSQLLGVAAIGVHDNFFELGGHSLLATQLISRIKTILQVELSIRSLFEAPTIAGSALRVEQALRDGVQSELLPLLPVSRTQPLPLSFAQQRLWFLDQLEPGSTAYLIPRLRRLHGSLDAVALEQSFATLIQRHESLRTTFAVENGQPVQIIHPVEAFQLPVVDLSGLRIDDRMSEAQRLAQLEKQQPCDLQQGPLLRVTLLSLDNQEHVLLLTMHHIISDAWSHEVFMRELIAAYRAYTTGQAPQLPALAIQYADFATWQRQWLQGEFLQAQIDYWTRQLAGVPILDLPTDRPRPAVQSSHGALLKKHLPVSLLDQLNVLAQREGVTLFMLLLAAFQVLLARYTGQYDVAVGTPIANRTRTELEGLIGFFVNTLVLRTNLADNPPFVELLRRVRNVALGAYVHQDVPFEKLVEVLQPERDQSRSPLFQVMFSVQQMAAPDPEPESAATRALQIKSFATGHQVAKFDLTFTVASHAQGLECSAEYNRDLFDASTIARLFAHWQVLLQGLVAAPQTPVASLPLLTDREHELLSQQVHASMPEVPSTLFPDRFAVSAQATPDAVAVVSEEGSVSYGVLERAANRLAYRLRERGVGPEVRVGVLLERSARWVIAVLAVLKAGGGYVPLEKDTPAARLAFQIADARLALLLIESTIEFVLTGSAAEVPTLDLWRTEWQAGCEDAPVSSLSPEHIAYVIYTSGSTGTPKGVHVTHGGLSNLIAAQAQVFGVRPESQVLQFSTRSFDASIFELTLALGSGASLVLAPPARLAVGEELGVLLERQGIAVATLPPSVLRTLPQVPLPALETLVVAGEACSEDLVEQWAPGRRMYNAYGPTEATVWATVQQCQAGEGTPALGRPIANTQVYVLDRYLEPVPPGVPGELFLGGVGLARGYSQAGITAERFLPHPLSKHPGERLYRTGDRVRQRSDGRLEFLGRLDHQVKVRGYRIELGEIEALLTSHPGIRDCVVIAHEQQQGNTRLIAYIVARHPDAAAELTRDALRSYLGQRLPEYMVPAFFIQLETLPLTSSGKVQRRALPLPETLESSQESVEAPRTPLEELLGEIWCSVLGRIRLGIHENFFAVGGHSLLATRLVSRLRTALRLELPLRSLFDAPTIAQFAQLVERAWREEQYGESVPLLPLPRTRFPAKFPLSFAQQRLWFLDQLEPESAAYLMPSTRWVQGRLNIRALEQSLTELEQRHESFRTTFEIEDGQPVQVIHAAEPFTLPVIDLSEITSSQRETLARQFATQEARRPFQLAQGPLWRGYVLCLASKEHMFLFTMHHIIADGWSNDVLFDELTKLYQAFSSGNSSPLPPLPIQYADFAVWQRQWLQGKQLQMQLAYWQQQLANAAALDLPTDYARPSAQTFRGALASLVLDTTLQGQLAALCQREGVTLFMALLAAFQVLLARYSGQSDISVGTPIANRTRVELEGLIGCFINTLVLRVDLADNPSFLTLLGRVREIALGAYAHQDVPFEQLVEILQPERDLSRSPLFQAMFNLQDIPAQSVEITDLTLRRTGHQHTTAKFDLTLTVTNSERGLSCALEYNTDLFRGSTIERLLQHWQVLVESIVAAPQTPVWRLPLLPAVEWRQLLNTFNMTTAPFPRHAGVHELFAAQAQRTPDALALVGPEGALSYAALASVIDRLAALLSQMGVTPGSRVAVCLERSLDLVVGLLAVMAAGAAYVPLDPAYPRERLAFMLTDSQASVLLSQVQLLSRLPQQRPPALLLPLGKQEKKPEAALPGDQVNSPEQLAYLIYTSGSTGRPKGTMILQRSLVNFLSSIARQPGVQARDRVLALTSISFDIAALELMTPLLLGACVVLATGGEGADGAALRSLLERESITLLQATPSSWHLLLAAGWSAGQRLKLLCGGEALPEKLAQQLVSTGGEVWNMYGPTETTIWSSLWRVPQETRRVMIGKGVGNTQLYVLDKHLLPAPLGVEGELYIGGEGVAHGYWQRAGLTAEKFVPDPYALEPGRRMYRTGDRACWREDGELEYRGRQDQQVKLRGYRIELGEIEAVLEQHPAIATCVVVVRQDASGTGQLVAYLIGLPAATIPDRQQLRQFLRAQLPEYMLPAHFVALDALPLTPNGKVDRRALPDPELREESAQHEASSAASPIEEIIEQVWCDVLHRPQIGMHENFFELGGHSLLATQCIARLRPLLQIELPLRTIFEAPTIAELAQRVVQMLRGEQGRDLPPLLPIPRTGELPLSFAQQRLWFLDQLAPENSAYLMPIVRHVRGPLELSALQRSLTELVRRHESLRTTFALKDDQPVQIIHPATDCPLPLLDLSALVQSQRSAIARQLARQEAQQPCSLEHGPLLRVHLVRMDQEEHLLLLTLHHIISDGWSNDVLFRDIMQLYTAFVENAPYPLAPLPVQYADYAVWQREWLQDAFLQEQVQYWTSRLAGAPALELPTDRPRPPVQTYRGDFLATRLPIALRDQLLELAHSENVTLFMLLLTAFQVLLARYSGQEDISVGVPIANRTRAELEGLIGFFVNTLVLRTDLSGNPPFRQLLAQVRETALGAYAHQDVPFEQLVETLQPERHLSRPPIFQVMFSVQQMADSDVEQESAATRALRVKGFATGHQVSKFDLTFAVASHVQGLECSAEYNRDLFDASTIARLFAHWQVLLQGLVAAPQTPVASLPLLTDREHELLSQQAHSSMPEVPNTLFPDRFAVSAQATPDAVAVVSEEGSVSYGMLERSANRLAHLLRERGVGPEVRVGVLLERSARWVIAVLAVLKAGGGYVPLEKSAPTARLAFQVADARLALLLIESPLELGSEGSAAEVPTLDLSTTEWQSGGEDAPVSSLHPEHIAYVIYTSGSTGTPKGVHVTHGGLSNLIAAQAQVFGVRPESQVLQFSTRSFDASIFELTLALGSGASLVLAPPARLAVGEELGVLLERQRIAVATLPPSVLRTLPQVPLPMLETLVVAGEACSEDLVEQWAPGRRMYNAYGPTEATVWATVQPCQAGEGTPALGRPIANTQVYVLDRYLEPVPPGVPGELFLGGVGLARGYSQAGITAERFLPHPLSKHPGERLYRTGDRVRQRSDGRLEFLGRLDHQVKVRGYRIELGEIEAVLRQHTSVQECHVLVDEHIPENQQLIAYLVVTPQASAPTSAELHDFVSQALPDYMVPASFVLLDKLPLTPHGKVDLRALLSLDSRAGVVRAETATPRTPIEETLLDIWRAVLDDIEISILDDFFLLGGHSLLATQIISRIRTRLQVDLSLPDFFAAPTIAGLAEVIERKQASLIEQATDAEISQMMTELEDLSDDEVRKLLTDDNV